ncbi:MAG: TRAP transporter substrate-binding protein DctP [Desulfuromonadales bacterium]|jgi:TRAP-type transport system periplasmic protein
MKKIGRALVILLVTLSFTALPAWAKDRWTAYTYASVASSSAVKGLNEAIANIETETGGNFKINLNLGGTLHIKAANITQAVADGIVDIASDLFYLGNVPIGGVLSLPMLITTEDEWQKAFPVMEPYLKKAFEEQGLVYLGAYRYPEQTIFTNFELKSAKDLFGKKIRVTSPEQASLVEHFGGSAVTMGGAEVPQALQRGVVDGVLTASAGGAKKWHEFLETNYRLPINYASSVIIANRDAFERLSPDHQKALVDAFASAGPKITDNFVIDERTQMEFQMSKGMNVIAADPADVASAQKAMETVWSNWAEGKGAEAKDALAAVRKAIGK